MTHKNKISEVARVAVILGHPAHELRIYRFLEKYRPRIFVLTDGSGALGSSRVYNTIRIIDQTHSKASGIMGRYTDAEFYNIILDTDTLQIKKIIDEIVLDLEQHPVDLIIGDSLEGYNPTHDLCRYIINAVAKIYSSKTNKFIPNYDFALEGPPDECPPDIRNEAIWLNLNQEEFERKYHAALNYPEIKRDLEIAIKLHAEAPFKTECLRPVHDLKRFTGWETDKPFYETYGLDKVKSGKYADVISYERHLLPLARFCYDYAESVS